MIIAESDGASDSKSNPATDSTNITAASASPAPPAYQTSPAPTPLPPRVSLLPTSPTLPLVGHKACEPAWRRFLKAFCFAGVIYLLLTILVKHFVRVAERHLVEGVPEGPRPEDGRIVSCVNGTWRSQVGSQKLVASLLLSDMPPYSSKTSFSLPVSADLVFLLSRGTLGGGSVTFKLNDHDGPHDKIEIEVVVSYYTHAALSRASVCHLKRDEGGQGLGFFTPKRFYPRIPSGMDQIKFETTVHFPRSGNSSHPLVINALETDIGHWSHHISSLEGRVLFKSISLKTSNSPIRVDSVSAHFANFKTSNSPITGSYNVSNSLTMITSNAAILADFRLENRDGHNPTRVIMKTSNGRIQTPLTLISTDTPSSASPAAFSVSASTSNSPLTVSFTGAPSSPFSHLTLSGKTSNSPAKIKLHPTYEGSISLRTSLFTPTVVQRSTSDPSGKGRHRNVEVRRMVKGSLEGGVWWGDDPSKEEGKGTLEVSTSNGGLDLQWGE